MGDHVHRQGEWMFSLRHMFMDMDGMYSGSSAISPSAVHAANYVVSPTRMTMDMQMLGAMFAPNDDLTLMLMLPHIDNEMDHVIQGGTPLVGLNGGSTTFTTRSEGIGDLKLTALLPYMLWLVGQVIKSNVEVAKLIWSPRLQLSPVVFRVKSTQKSKLAQVIYANSITLTPGTVSINLWDGEIRVHALTEDGAKGLEHGVMDAKVTALEGD